MGSYYVYIMTNRKKTLYIGMTGDLERRVREHKGKLIRGFARKYDITRLVWFEEFYSAEQSIAVEKKLKGWLRSKKIALIEQHNPAWEDLAATIVQNLHSEQHSGHSERSEESSAPPDPSLRSG
jgi:putative endonuclease